MWRSFLCIFSVLFTFSIETVSTGVVHRPSLERRTVAPQRSCDRSIPFPGQVLTMGDKVNDAVTDAQLMIRQVLHNSDFIESTAYSKYFRRESEEAIRVARMYRAMYDAIEGANLDDQIAVYCGDDVETICTHEASGAVGLANGAPFGNWIVFCNPFFDPYDERQRHSITSRAYNASGWCQTGRDLSFFQIPAMVVIRAMTQMDALGRRAEFPENRYVSSRRT